MKNVAFSTAATVFVMQMSDTFDMAIWDIKIAELFLIANIY